ncbi:HpcH/HpaI aldolase family protein [Desulfovibrio psychrotolerans]|nr:aldolase/citrate lyase family protein [Desulfovibrio psychrotolerans]
MTIAALRQKLSTGGHTVGSWMQIPSPDVAELMGNSGYDWIAVDLEHGAFTRSDLPDTFRAIDLGGSLPFARVADCTMTSIKGALDSGAAGLIFPMIESRKQLDDAISLSLYPPNGIRGVGYCRGNLFGKQFEQGVAANPDLFFCAQIEHVRAIDNLSAILAHPRLDAIMVGPYDLSGSMGLTGQFGHSDFTQALSRIAESARSACIPMGLHVVQPDAAALRSKIEEGYQFIAYGIDSVFLYNSAERPIW